MTHFGILCPPATGHLNPITTLGHELVMRGNRVTLIGVLDAQPKAVAAGLEFCPLAEHEYPSGAVARSLARLGELDGVAAVIYTIKRYTEGATVLLRDAPAAIKRVGIEALLIDQSTIEGGTIAEYIGLPFVTICSALLLNPEPAIPPALTSWDYDASWWAHLRNQLGYAFFSLLAQPLGAVIEEYRKRWKLPSYSDASQIWSQLAQLSQQPAEFEFPRQHLPPCFHFTGPYNNPVSREPAPFPYEMLNGKPLVYASLGTVQNRLLYIFCSIAEACVGLDVQLVISLGGSGSPESLPKLPGSPLVVGYAPQLELLQKATLTITHAGLNTTLESLSNGVPMVAIPITSDQPGVAARLAWTGAGEVVPLAHLSVPKLREAIQRVLTEYLYKQNAVRLQEAICRAGGASRAADIVEQVIHTGKPVYK